MSPPPPASVALSSPLDDAALASISIPAIEEARLRRQAFIAVLVAAGCIGFSPIFVRLADTGPAAIGFWRMLFAVGPTALWAYAEWRAMKARHVATVGAGVRLRPFSGRQFAFGTLAGLFFAADLVFFHAALANTSTANSVLLGNMAPVFVLLFAWACLGERPTLGLFIALVLAMAGSAIIVLDSTSAAAGINSLLGDLLATGAAACYAAYMIVVRVMRRGGHTHGGVVRVPGLGGGMVALISTAAGAVFCLAYAVGAGEQIVPASLQGFLAVVGLGIVAHAFGQGLATFALGRLTAGTISIVLLLQIVIGISMAALLFGEVPSLTVLFGGGLIVAGILAVRPR
ncbi:DMT family transporter [Starkeya sp. ORNL1]|uniref:DMT family transporter n=1 Tax=Starkeya sp. ORNL1 TaxID=2709380 RepID=UPI0014638403|nr:DMT family transporter [Starkeya sp. ORNL1]QJP13549.1 DMT family transporter [Starkeya sp. ORNL1]